MKTSPNIFLSLSSVVALISDNRILKIVIKVLVAIIRQSVISTEAVDTPIYMYHSKHEECMCFSLVAAGPVGEAEGGSA